MLTRIAGALLAVAALTPAPELSDANFSHWRQFLQPSAQEQRWQEIPWRSEFWDAVYEARKRDRPLLVWAMNGHPLACT